jgi:dienelactone hydrolase
VAQRLADAGYVVGRPTCSGASARVGAEHDDAGLAASFEKVQQLDADQAIRDCVAAIERLAEVDGVDARPAVIGFCLGRDARVRRRRRGRPSCCVSYYGSASRT